MSAHSFHINPIVEKKKSLNMEEPNVLFDAIEQTLVKDMNYVLFEPKLQVEKYLKTCQPFLKVEEKLVELKLAVEEQNHNFTSVTDLKLGFETTYLDQLEEIKSQTISTTQNFQSLHQQLKQLKQKTSTINPQPESFKPNSILSKLNRFLTTPQPKRKENENEIESEELIRNYKQKVLDDIARQKLEFQRNLDMEKEMYLSKFVQHIYDKIENS